MRPRDDSGFVLLMVLAVIFIAGTVLAACARRSCRQALQAGAARGELQLRWGIRSIRDLCLPAAERFLTEQAVIDGAPVATARRSVALGGIAFHLVVSDEQAKANVNLLAERGGQANLPGTLRRLQTHQRKVLPVRLRPATYTAAGITRYPIRYAGLGQVFQFTHPRQLIDPRLDDPPAAGAGRITCWGSGKVNFKRADVEVLRAVLAGILTETQLDRLRKFRSEVPDCTLHEAIKHLELKKDAAGILESYLTDASGCHALWIVAEGKTRNWYRLYVCQRADAGNDSQQWTFEW